ncbi:sigma-70 family RNA polymerase sigma factor [Sphingobacterium gobiense]|uniref:RNA polymerase subunit sigma n=1 Tax=Sphingobacterium gobiense TaxID=1382456 RepID=A0A2S9JNB7_9SPHI|nr:sigma-70 family RNA polymerase sigma factor [Sphingobacterium gobiense]PRD54596.1 hypothetical protein C5749_14220 [Sphingobacterium gobiense]
MKCDIFNIWAAYRQEIKGYVKKRVTDEDDVNDIMQSVLIKITDYCETKNNVKFIKAWLYKVALNTLIDFHKKSKRTTTHSNFGQLYLHSQQEYDENIFVWLYNFIDELPTEYSEPLRLSDIEGMPQKEIAEQLGLTLTATKSRVQRARKMLRNKFDECGTVEPSESYSMSYTITKSCCLK